MKIHGRILGLKQGSKHTCDLRHKDGSVRQRRLVQAIAFMLLSFGVLVVVDFSEAQAETSPSSSIFDAWAQWGESQRLLDGDIPEGFEREVLLLQDKQELRVDAGADTVGFSFCGSSDDVWNMLRQNLLGNDWVEVPSGIDDCASFIKEHGEYRWLFVQCVSIQDWISVVINYEHQSS